MLNIGIVGNTEVLEPYVKDIQRNKNVNVIGKSSVGTSTQLNSFHFSIPEFNRVELIERAEILLVDNSFLLPFDLLCSIVKKGKHIFATEYLNLTVEECSQLIKLSNESGSLIQVSNPFYYTSAIQFINQNLSAPLFIDVSKFSNDVRLKNVLFPLLLMLKDITGLMPKKVGAISFQTEKDQSYFTNLRLEFGNASVVNISFGNRMQNNKFEIEAYSKDQFISLDITKGLYQINQKGTDLSESNEVGELDSFIDSIQNQDQKTSNLEEYQLTLILFQTINKKISQFVT